MIRKIWKYLYGLKRHEKLLKVPRQYANDVVIVDRDSALIMGSSNARSPENVRALLKRYKVDTVEQLYELLPDQHFAPRPRSRFITMMRNLTGALPYNPDMSRARYLKRLGILNPDSQEIIERIKSVKDYK